MKYTDQELREIKQNNPLLDIFQEKGFELVKKGNHFTTNCPFHKDKNPSLIITPKNNLWNCLGCPSDNGHKKGGDIFDFLMKYEGLSFIDAVAYLKNKTPSKLENKANVKEIILPLPDQKLLTRITEFYQACFREDKRGFDYLANKRNIKSPEIFERFKIGFANGSLLKTIPEKGALVEELKKIGFLTDTGHEFFRNCVIFPVFDARNNIVQIYGRKINDDNIRHLYLPGDLRGIFNIEILKSYDEIILTESIIDSLSLYEAGLKNTIPCFGINGFTEEHIKAFKENNTKKIIVLFDGDEAGKKGALNISVKLQKLFPFSCQIISLPDGEDPNSYLVKQGKEALEEFVYTRLKNPDLSSPSEPETHKSEPPASPDMETKNQPSEIFFNQPEQDSSDSFTVSFCKRKYLVKGIESGRNRLKANIRAQSIKRFYIDTVDLYNGRARRLFLQEVCKLFKESPEIIGQDLDNIIEAAEKFVKTKSEEMKGGDFVITEPDKKEALNFGMSNDLAGEIIKEITKCGYVGEEINKLLCYIAMSSRKMEKPLSVMIISGSGAGKTMLQDTILELCPPEDLLKLTSLTGKALFYKKEQSLKNKVLALEEEKGAEDADYAIRNLITSNALIIEATIKDAMTGKLTTMTNRVECSTSVFKTTTNPETDPETKSRFLILSIDESREQTQRILDYQRFMDTEEGLREKSERIAITRKHRNFQRMLKSVEIINPYSRFLKYQDDRMLVRRDNPKYLSLIKAIAFLNQFKRKIFTTEDGRECIKVTLSDITLANKIAHEILGKSLDELTTPSRNLLNIIYNMVSEIAEETGAAKEEINFTRRQVREYTKWSEYQLRTHIKQLVDLEYLLPLTGKHGKQFCYELLYDGEGNDGARFLLGLKDIESLKKEAENVGIYE